MTKSFYSTIEYISNYNFGDIKHRFIKRFSDIDEYQYLLIEEALKDFYIANYLIQQKEIKNINYLMPPNFYVDELWHLHIIYTHDYFDFTKKVYGSYLHHKPTPENEKDINFSFEEAINDLFKTGQYLKQFRTYKLQDLNHFKLHPNFSLLSQVTDYLNEIPFETVLNNV